MLRLSHCFGYSFPIEKTKAVQEIPVLQANAWVHADDSVHLNVDYKHSNYCYDDANYGSCAEGIRQGVYVRGD